MTGCPIIVHNDNRKHVIRACAIMEELRRTIGRDFGSRLLEIVSPQDHRFLDFVDLTSGLIVDATLTEKGFALYVLCSP